MSKIPLNSEMIAAAKALLVSDKRRLSRFETSLCEIVAAAEEGDSDNFGLETDSLRWFKSLCVEFGENPPSYLTDVPALLTAYEITRRAEAAGTSVTALLDRSRVGKAAWYKFRHGIAPLSAACLARIESELSQLNEQGVQA